MTIRSVVFDMGKVLVHFSHDRMFEAMGEVCGATGGQIREWLWDSGLQQRFERGEIDQQTFLDSFLPEGPAFDHAAFLDLFRLQLSGGQSPFALASQISENLCLAKVPKKIEKNTNEK